MGKNFSTLIKNSLLALGAISTLFPSIALLANIFGGDFVETIFFGGGGIYND